MISSINSTTLLKFDSSPPENLQRDSKRPSRIVDRRLPFPIDGFQGQIVKLRGSKLFVWGNLRYKVGPYQL